MSVSAYSVSLSANAGVSLQMGPHRIWVDALHTRQAEGFSTVSPELWARICLLYTSELPTTSRV